jgi:site-specific recombinase XerD
VFLRGHIWWISYFVRGQRFRESAKSEKRADAVRLLKLRTGRVAAGHAPAPDVSRTRFDDLANILLDNYEANGRRSIRRVRAALGHLRDRFGMWHATAITADEITNYVRARQKAGAKPATINREQAALKRAFHLARRAGKVADIPAFDMLAENNVRTGYMDEADLDRLLEHLPRYLHNLVAVAFFTGWRTNSELLTRERRHVRDGWLVLEVGEGKTRKARQFPVAMIPRLKAAIDDQLERVAAMEKSLGRVIPWLFVGATGERIKSFRTAWLTARVKAGLLNAIPHDFRRVAVRALNAAGVPIKTAMEMVGHRTMSVYHRYDIVDERDLRAGGEKLAAYYEKRKAFLQKVVPLKTGTEK